MLNRTLSANLNGLNLGTRTLATLAGLNIVATPCVRHDHPRKRKDSMRGETAKDLGGSSISIRGRFPFPPPSSHSPFGPSSWPYSAGASLRAARSEVVVVTPVPVEASVSAIRAERASWAGWSQAEVQPQQKARTRQTMAPAESIPVARYATGG